MTGQMGNKYPLVSVIINCYNGSEFLSEAMNSVCSQTYENWEIIFWDNCSTDNSPEIAKQYGNKVKYYRAESNTVLGEARNKALAKASGKYITFIDCDDVWCDPDKLREQVELMETNPDYGLCYGSIEEIYTDNSHFRNVITLYESGDIFEELLYQFDISIITSMLRKSFLEESRLNFDPQVKASEEYCLFMQMACRYKIGVTKKIYAKYRVHMTSLTSRSLSILGAERRYTLNKILQFAPSLRKKYKNAFREAFARGDYYDARWYMSEGLKGKAFSSLSRNALVSLRYFILMILSLFPVVFWNKVHILKRNRV
ncbi:MAG: glycosyltransferase family 2 protein [Chitinophagaceae bacterium]|nr:glycosyltransferase family 2 protein [Chitinophagaceae bacterium]MCA6459658.1 glycosyltransferase family 2 protein [Chitinophagaceae bacterium]MCA6464525.1 glycosyltransferase family 2 protein [Chitinophagaceae bacterium]